MSIQPEIYKGEKRSIPEYSKQIIREFQGNPLIEALPDLMTEKEVYELFLESPVIEEYEKNFDVYRRSTFLRKLRYFVHPLSFHFDLERLISDLIRWGYVSRNPLAYDFEEMLFALDECYELNLEIDKYEQRVFPVIPTAEMALLMGASGLGKSLATQKILESYPQVISHSKYNGKNMLITQIVWLKIDCSHDGSVKGLCINFFRALDAVLGNTEYERQHGKTTETVNKMFSSMASLAFVHNIGILVIDEIQNMNIAGQFREKLVSFIVTMENSIGVPILLVGTPAVSHTLQSSFMLARRVTMAGSIILDRLDRNDDFYKLLNRLWKYQWLKNETELTEELVNEFYERTQGITAVVIALFIAVQKFALSVNDESIKIEYIKEAAEEELKPLLKLIKKIKLGGRYLAEIDDIEDHYLDQIFNRNYEPVDIDKVEASIEELKKKKSIKKKDLESSVFLFIEKYNSFGSLTDSECSRVIEKIYKKNHEKDNSIILVECITALKKLQTKKEKGKHQTKEGRLIELYAMSVASNVPIIDLLRKEGFVKNCSQDFDSIMEVESYS